MTQLDQATETQAFLSEGMAAPTPAPGNPADYYRVVAEFEELADKAPSHQKAAEYRQLARSYKNLGIIAELSRIICDAFWNATDAREAINDAFHVLHTHERSS